MMKYVLGPVLLLAAFASAAFGSWLPVGPWGGNVVALAVAPSDPATMVCMVYAPDTLLPVFRTTDAGAGWQRVGSAPRVAGAAIDPFDPAAVYCLDGSWLFRRSTDGGATWQSQSLPFVGQTLSCDPFVPGRVYVAGAYYDSIPIPALAVSTDHGATWSSWPMLADTGSVYSLDASPLDSGTIYAGTDHGAFFRSTDLGASWEERSNGLTPGDILLSLSASHGDAGIVCAGTITGVFRTTDAGASWTQAGDPWFVMSVDLSPAQPANGYCHGWDTAEVCYSTTDAGVSWQPMAHIVPSVRGGGLCADPVLGDGAWCPTVAGVMHTTDRGVAWSPVNRGINSSTITSISVPGWDREHVYLEVEGVGVYKSLDAGETWEKCADFLSCGSICGIGLAPALGGDRLYALEGSG